MTGRGVRKKLIGVVIEDKMDKTAVVKVSRLKKHKTYNKYIRSRTKYMTHDPHNSCKVGDTVKIIESRPISKRKRWQLIEIIQKGTAEESNENINGHPMEQTS